MNITKAYCEGLKRSLNISEARSAYFSQATPRKRFVFHCSSPQCREDGSFPVVIKGVNYDKISEDNPHYQKAHYRSQDVDAHSADCAWVIEEEAKQLIAQERGIKRNNGSGNTVNDGPIEQSTFIAAEKRRLKSKSKKKDQEGLDEDEADFDEMKATRSSQVQSAKTKLENGVSSSSFSDLVSDYLEIFRNNAWDTPLEIMGSSVKTYGKFFRKVEWYKQDHWQHHIHFGSVKVTKLYPQDFEFSQGLPLAVNLKFDQEVMLDGVTAKPTLYITKEQFSSASSAHVLAETIRLASDDDRYLETLWCHFYGEIKVKNVSYTNNKNELIEFKTLEVIPLSMRTIELILRSRKI